VVHSKLITNLYSAAGYCGYQLFKNFKNNSYLIKTRHLKGLRRMDLEKEFETFSAALLNILIFVFFLLNMNVNGFILTL